MVVNKEWDGEDERRGGGREKGIEGSGREQEGVNPNWALGRILALGLCLASLFFHHGSDSETLFHAGFIPGNGCSFPAHLTDFSLH
jgi:hypothetical protein